MMSEIAVHDKVHGTDLNRQQCPGHGEKSGNGTCQEDGLEESQGREFLQDSTDSDLSLSECLLLKSASSSPKMVTQRLAEGHIYTMAGWELLASIHNLLCSHRLIMCLRTQLDSIPNAQQNS